MPTRTLTITEEAYQALKAQKRKGESFSDVILRLTAKKGDPARLLAAMKSGEFYSPDLAKNIEEVSRDMRKNFKLRDVEF